MLQHVSRLGFEPAKVTRDTAHFRPTQSVERIEQAKRHAKPLSGLPEPLAIALVALVALFVSADLRHQFFTSAVDLGNALYTMPFLEVQFHSPPLLFSCPLFSLVNQPPQRLRRIQHPSNDSFILLKFLCLFPLPPSLLIRLC